MLALYGFGRYPAITEFTMLPLNNRNSFSVNIKIIPYFTNQYYLVFESE